MVSPGRGNLSLKVVKSTLALPTTAILGTLLIGFPRDNANAEIYHDAPCEQPALRLFFALRVCGSLGIKYLSSIATPGGIFWKTGRAGGSYDWRHAHDFLQQRRRGAAPVLSQCAEVPFCGCRPRLAYLCRSPIGTCRSSDRRERLCRGL